MGLSNESFKDTRRINDEENELEDKASSLIKPTLQSTGPIQFVDLVDKIFDQLGFGKYEIKPLPIRAAVWNAWHQDVFSVASDRTVTLNNPHQDITRSNNTE